MTMNPAPPEVVEYAPGRLMDVHRPACGVGPWPVVLLWHGRGPDERDVLRPLANEAAGLGLLVLVPDWRSDEEDGGRAHLLASFGHARRHAAGYGGDPTRFVLAGWSLGGREAVALATHPSTPAEDRPTAAVGIASSYVRPAVTTGEPPLPLLAGRPSPVPLWLVHGTRDDLVPAELTRELSDAVGNPASRLLEPDTDHAGVVLTEFDPAISRCRPARAAHAVDAGRATARVLAEAARASAG
ncbi:alpha/beta hydrolase [Streptomyces sp. CB01881]|uniref:alpha/beta hydrolase n=1 Tax=Streptomyces sp. CB01881 TaxID=2078691 RepID=UPI001F11B74E|nr:alpha/beta hydrolase [Streptomyces sp. CB01881]